MDSYKDAIVELRMKLNVSQDELAKKLGVSFLSINRWENGRHMPTKIVKLKLSKSLE